MQLRRRERVWLRMHLLVNTLAWRFARPPGPDRGSALRIDHSRLLWRLNDWTAGKYLPRWIKR